MANQSKLKAWVRYDGTGRVVTAGPIFSKAKPKVGNWRQINSGLCCNPSGSTTTTTTQGGGSVTPTAWVAKAADRQADSALRACNNPDATILLYTSVNTVPLPPNTLLYTDAALTTLISTTYPDYVYVSINDWVYQVEYNGYTSLNPAVTCSSITTTTSTTQAPVLSFIGAGDSSTGGACNAVNGTQTFYTTGPLVSGNYPQNGITVYFDQALTQPVTYPYVAAPGIGQVWNCANGVLSNQSNCF